MTRRPLGVALIGSLLLVALGFSVARPWLVHGGSMEPAVPNGALVVADDLGPTIEGYRRGDIVVLSRPAASADIELPFMLKRVIGVAGDRLRIAAGRVFVNGAPLVEPYLTPAELTGVPVAEGVDLTVPPGEVFVLGDNRAHSRDSKSFGPIPLTSLRGRVWLVLAPGYVGAPIGVPAALAAPASP